MIRASTVIVAGAAVVFTVDGVSDSDRNSGAELLNANQPVMSTRTCVFPKGLWINTSPSTLTSEITALGTV